MATVSFGAHIEEWVRDVEGAMEAVFRESVSDLVGEMNELVTRLVYNGAVSPSGYIRTGFLRASLVASTTAMPALTRSNPGGSFPVAPDQIEAVISGADLGTTIYLGYTAEYGAYVHYGANGRQPRPWVTMAAQRWSMIVDAKVAELKAKLGL
jgi:hypothetical protein